jgi:hypothetical protein
MHHLSHYGQRRSIAALILEPYCERQRHKPSPPFFRSTKKEGPNALPSYQHYLKFLVVRLHPRRASRVVDHGESTRGCTLAAARRFRRSMLRSLISRSGESRTVRVGKITLTRSGVLRIARSADVRRLPGVGSTETAEAGDPPAAAVCKWLWVSRNSRSACQTNIHRGIPAVIERKKAV